MNPIYDYIQNIRYSIFNFNKKKEQYRKKVNFFITSVYIDITGMDTSQFMNQIQ